MSEKTCVICNAPIPKTRASNNVKYCSVKCARTAEKNRRIDYIKKRANAFTEKTKYKFYQAYDCKCAICGWQMSDKIYVNGKCYFSHGNELHHIIPACEGGNEGTENIICLCPNHHKMANVGLLSREYLKSLVKDYIPVDNLKNGCAEEIARMIFEEVEE